MYALVRVAGAGRERDDRHDLHEHERREDDRVELEEQKLPLARDPQPEAKLLPRPTASETCLVTGWDGSCTHDDRHPEQREEDQHHDVGLVDREDLPAEEDRHHEIDQLRFRVEMSRT